MLNNDLKQVELELVDVVPRLLFDQPIRRPLRIPVHGLKVDDLCFNLLPLERSFSFINCVNYPCVSGC